VTVSVAATPRDGQPASAQPGDIALDVLVRISADVVFHREALGVMSDESGGEGLGSKGSGIAQLSLDLDAA